MKKQLQSTSWAWLLLLIGLCACTSSEKQTDYTHAIPANATEIAAINLADMALKAGLNQSESSEATQKIIHLLMEGGSTSFTQQMEAIGKNPAETGIDWSQPAYFFKAPSLHAPALSLKLLQPSKLQALLETLAAEGLCTAPAEAEGYRSCALPDNGIGLAFNKGTLLIVYAGSNAQLQKLQPAVTALMNQPAEKSLHTHPHFTALQKQKGDICFLATPDALPFELRGVFSWPQGTPLTGYALFENGRIYGNLQRADFEGETSEGNQPFHPQNSLDLQKAINTMRYGHPFNIELTTEELLTLTNLRVRMEFTPNDPDVQTRYRLIQKIETMNVRGDGNRTKLTVVLKDSQNPLKQLADEAILLFGL